jgi:hypothetical protein
MVGTNPHYVSDAKKIKEAKARQWSRTDIRAKMPQCNNGQTATKTSGFCSGKNAGTKQWQGSRTDIKAKMPECNNGQSRDKAANE